MPSPTRATRPPRLLGVAGVVVLVLAAGCSTSKNTVDTSAGAGPAAEASASPSSQPSGVQPSAGATPGTTSTSAATQSSTPAASTSAVGSGSVRVAQGTGYTLRLPSDFVHYAVADQAAQAENSHLRRLGDGSIQMIGVSVRPAQGSLTQAAEQVAQAARDKGATGVELLDQVQLDGVPAVPVAERRLVNGIPAQMREYVVLHGGHRYVLYVGASQTADDQELAAQLGGVLQGWRWA